MRTQPGEAWLDAATRIIKSAELPDDVVVDYHAREQCVELNWHEGLHEYDMVSRISDHLGSNPSYNDGTTWAWTMGLTVEAKRVIAGSTRGVAGLCALLAGGCECDERVGRFAHLEAPYYAYEEATRRADSGKLESHPQLDLLVEAHGAVVVLAAAELLGSEMKSEDSHGAYEAACRLGHLKGLLEVVKAL